MAAAVAPAPPSGAASGAPLPGHVDVLVVGAGFSGLAMAHRLREAGFDDVLVLERGHEVGGTWRDNSYPGCMCDVPSHLYSLSFALNPNWTSTFSPQAEIQQYLRGVARDHDLDRFVRTGCELIDAGWDATTQRWQVSTGDGELTARVVIAATGGLSEPAVPDLPGLASFTGTVFHSAHWDHGYDLDGARVAVVGTGASAIQFVPQIAPRVGRMHVFQRTPPWIMPRRARPLRRIERLVYRNLPGAQRLMRTGTYYARELYALPMLRVRLSRVVAAACRSHLRRQVPDPQLRARLTPDYAPGCKRILLSNDYLPALSLPNVEVVTDAIAEVRSTSVVTRGGEEREVDTIIFGTGFHITDQPIATRIRAGGRTLAEVWDGSPQAHRGTTVAGFPNLFLLLGPNTALGHTSVLVMAEAQVGYVVAALTHMRRRAVAAIVPRPEAQARWNERLQAALQGTVWLAGGCASWYLDRHGRSPVLWPHFTVRFRRELARFDAGSYAVSAGPVAGPEPAETLTA